MVALVTTNRLAVAFMNYKIDLGPGFRIYYGKIRLQVILLLCAGDKRSQQKDIVLAKEYFQDFKARGDVND